MPTRPVGDILDRDLSRAAALGLIDRFVPMMEELVNYGSNVYARSKPSVPNPDLTESDAPLQLYLHVLEMADGVTELLRQSCAAPAIPLVRTIFEAVLSIEYILETDTSRRARSWLVAYALQQLEACNYILGEEKSGANLSKALQGDLLGSKVDLSGLAPAARVQKPIFEAYLQKPEFAEILSARTAAGERYPKWYALFGGPKNLRELAKVLQQEAQYLVLYGFWSSIDHGSNTRRFVTRARSTDPTARLIRDASEFNGVVLTATSYVLNATRIILQKYRAGEDMSKWYIEEIRPRFMGKTGA